MTRDIKLLLSQEYKHRLRNRPFRPDLESINLRKKKIFEIKMKIASSKRSPDWTMAQLERALSSLKKNKSRDYQAFINEIFKICVIGDNLKKS